ncbi:MAG: GlcNAc-PI de-N-acetylase [Desulfobulbaceae bacterium]|nr:MAG: GlcNAc-PI de-N-acetylase [Desulfobulbaceae bacterium]
MRQIIVAPHPDDEVLGVGGTILRRKAEGAKVAWLIVTAISVDYGWDSEKVKQRTEEIKRVTDLFGFDEVFTLNFPPAQLDQVSMSDLVAAISGVFKLFEPEEVFVPHPSDVHTDHRIVFDAVTGCTKWFRYPFVKRILAYETLSETDFGLGPHQGFRPNVFINIEPFLNDKLRAMGIYASEQGLFPFPRSHEAIHALASLRGAASGFKAAEAFELLRERS